MNFAGVCSSYSKQSNFGLSTQFCLFFLLVLLFQFDQICGQLVLQITQSSFFSFLFTPRFTLPFRFVGPDGVAAMCRTLLRDVRSVVHSTGDFGIGVYFIGDGSSAVTDVSQPCAGSSSSVVVVFSGTASSSWGGSSVVSAWLSVYVASADDSADSCDGIIRKLLLVPVVDSLSAMIRRLFPQVSPLLNRPYLQHQLAAFLDSSDPLRAENIKEWMLVFLAVLFVENADYSCVFLKNNRVTDFKGFISCLALTLAATILLLTLGIEVI